MWKHFHRYGVFAPQFADKLALIDNDVSLTTAFNEKFLLKHGSTTSFDEVIMRIHFVCTVNSQINVMLFQAGNRYVPLFSKQ